MKLFDVVALIVDLPDAGLKRGQVGTIIEQLDEVTFEVEFSDDGGNCYASLPIQTNRLLVLHFQPENKIQVA